jgi:ATP-dependent Lhr-like helicase
LYNIGMDNAEPLALFLPPVQRWFRSALGEPTAAQRLGWPAIAAGQNTLILAPTGSGKTLASFLACLDALWRQPQLPRGVRVLYISPLKALNNDIHRNLQVPLEGVARTAQDMGLTLPVLEAAVRTGDTPTAERQRLIRKPPHILITTPESLHLLLTSRARETLRGVTHCIVDEIHALCTNKRGVFLSLLLERLQALQSNRFVRIGLSATQRPLEEVARYLGGREPDAEGIWQPRPVTIVDAGLRKDLDLQVVSPVEQFGPLPERTIWPSIYRLLGDEIRQHRSTIVFANNRRAVERITSCLNEEDEIARAHHGSVSLEVRQQIEAALKEGRLPAVVATASLEMGIDMGSVELVCQVESPGNVARALQRVGRAGHLVGQRSKGRLIPKMPNDLLEQAVLAREMAAGRVEEIRVPINCLDVLAQQLVACAAVDDWNVPDLLALVRRAYPFRDLSPHAFEATLEMISGRYQFGRRQSAVGSRQSADGQDGSDEPKADRRKPVADSRKPLAAFHPRVSWDRVHNRLLALPGSRQMALVNGGTIPDTGQYAVITGNGTRIGELDEEFIYERRVGDAFLLGTNAWRIENIEADRVIVTPADGAAAIVPFWRGESTGRSHDLGRALGAFLRELGDRIDTPDCLSWLQSEYSLEKNAARNLRYHVERQLRAAGCLPTDRTLLIEAARDPLGDWQVVLLSPFGNRLHLSLRLALESRLRERLGYSPQCLHHNDGILIRLTDTDEPILDLFDGLTPENVENRILDELADSALFALRFRQNAARSLLLPRVQPGRRAPLWLQRLRGRDLLQVARGHADFPIVAETFRECLHDHLDVERLQQLLAAIRAGEVQVVTRRADTPSPFAAGLAFSFTAAFMYQYDGVEADGERSHVLDRELLEQLVSPSRQGHLLDPRAVQQVERRLRGVGQPPRSATEMAEWLRRLGDLTVEELEGPMAAFLEQLEREGRACRLDLPRSSRRWIAAEDVEQYRQAFALENDDTDTEQRQEAAAAILQRFLNTHALVGLADVLARYPFEPGWARRQLEEWASSGRIVVVSAPEAETTTWSDPENLEQVRRGSLGILRREVVTCSPPQFADFLLRWQGVHPETRRGGSEGLALALQRLQGLALDSEVWEQTVLPSRLPEYQPRWLDEWIAGGEGLWVCQGTANDENDTGRVAFLRRDDLRRCSLPESVEQTPLSDKANRILDHLRGRGASFLVDIAADLGISPGEARSALGELVRRCLATNDRFDAIRMQSVSTSAGRLAVAREPWGADANRSASRSRRAPQRPEGRWSAIAWGRPEPEARAVAQAGLLLERYGIVSRELALLDPWLLPWRILYEVLSRMELAGEVRRGYFAEGLSGAQFALPDAARQLHETHVPSTATAPVVLLHSMDPANLYGSGAPFDIPLLDGGSRPLLRRPGNWLVLRAGRPVLLIEQHGKRLTALASASRDEVAAAVACLPRIVAPRGGLAIRHKLTVEEWNGQPITASEGRELLESAGFVRDYQAMTLYAVWK